MKTFILFLILLSSFNITDTMAQTLINSKFDLYLGAKKDIILGSKNLSTNVPALYAGMGYSRSFVTRGIYNYSDYISFGGCLEVNDMSSWNNNRFYYQGSSATVISLGPTISVHTPFNPIGDLNLFKFYLQLSTVAGISTTNFNSLLVSADYIYNSDSNTRTSTDLFRGAEILAGFRMNLSSLLGIYLNFGLKAYYGHSKLYNDTYFYNKFIETGIFLRLFKDKRFNYK